MPPRRDSSASGRAARTRQRPILQIPHDLPPIVDGVRAVPGGLEEGFQIVFPVSRRHGVDDLVEFQIVGKNRGRGGFFPSAALCGVARAAVESMFSGPHLDPSECIDGSTAGRLPPTANRNGVQALGRLNPGEDSTPYRTNALRPA